MKMNEDELNHRLIKKVASDLNVPASLVRDVVDSMHECIWDVLRQELPVVIRLPYLGAIANKNVKYSVPKILEKMKNRNKNADLNLGRMLKNLEDGRE